MIGYYAHSHGSGHCNYAKIFSKIFKRSLTVFTDRDYNFDRETNVICLENENPDGTEFHRDRFAEPPALHYAPVHMRKITRRNCIILDAIVQKKIELLIIDVSVEIAMLARVSSIPYAYVRLQGDRTDLPHINAFEGASFLLAYFPEELEDATTSLWIREKTIYLGFLSQFSLEGQNSERPPEYEEAHKPILLHLSGFGGHRSVDFENLCGHYDIYSVGPTRLSKKAVGVTQIGVVDSTRPYIQHADMILAACGLNTTSEILSLGKRFIAQPEKRHYSEQERTACNLHRMKWGVNTNACQNLGDAVALLKTWNRNNNLPKIDLDILEKFYRDLRKTHFRADHFLKQRRPTNYSSSELSYI